MRSVEFQNKKKSLHVATVLLLRIGIGRNVETNMTVLAYMTLHVPVKPQFQFRPSADEDDSEGGLRAYTTFKMHTAQ